MKALRLALVLLAVLGPPVLALAAAGAILGRGPVALVALLAAAATLNSLWPIGGGNGASGTLRIRLLRREWTADLERDPALGTLGAMALAAVTVSGFVAAAPLLAVVWRHALPDREGVPEVLALGSAVALVGAGLLSHKRELPLRRWVAELPGLAEAELARRVEAVIGLEQDGGAFGHVGGIGAFTVGLHEALEAERILREGAARGIPEATAALERCLAWVAAQELPGGGFPVYPGGAAREALTVRAREALRRPE